MIVNYCLCLTGLWIAHGNEHAWINNSDNFSGATQCLQPDL